MFKYTPPMEQSLQESRAISSLASRDVIFSLVAHQHHRQLKVQLLLSLLVVVYIGNFTTEYHIIWSASSFLQLQSVVCSYFKIFLKQWWIKVWFGKKRGWTHMALAIDAYKQKYGSLSYSKVDRLPLVPFLGSCFLHQYQGWCWCWRWCCNIFSGNINISSIMNIFIMNVIRSDATFLHSL